MNTKIIFYYLITAFLIMILKRLTKRNYRDKENYKVGGTRKQRQQDYRRYLKSDHWKQTRAKILIRDNYRCKRCGSTTRLQVHHLTYVRRGHEADTDLITLCDKCHRKAHHLK